MEEPARPTVWAGTQRHEICSEHAVTHPELSWLAQELSDWLGPPIDRD